MPSQRKTPTFRIMCSNGRARLVHKKLSWDQPEIVKEELLKRYIIKDLGYPTPCWQFTQTNVPGYGVIKVDHKKRAAHRISWIIHNGPIPNGMLICHKCDQRSCINPDHLFIGTYKDNSQDASQKHKIFLARGELNGNSKLKRIQVHEIRKLCPSVPGTELAKRYKVHKSTISLIIKGRNWKYD